MALTEQQKQLAAINRRQKRLTKLIVEHGVRFKPQPLPKGFRKMRAQDCYHNCYRLLLRFDENLTYCECMLFGVIPHAFLVDPEGNVIDPTLNYDPEREYFGVPLRTGFVLTTFNKTGLCEDLLWEVAGLSPKQLKKVLSPREFDALR